MADSSFHSFIAPVEPTSSNSPRQLSELFPDEVDSLRLSGCRISWQFGDVLGATVVCTNYRLVVLPDDTSHHPANPRRFRVFDERFSIPFCSVLNIRYAVFNGGKTFTPSRLTVTKRKERELKEYKPLTSAFSSMDIISALKIYLKDMRVLIVDLRGTQNSSSLANHCLHFSRPPSVDKAFPNLASHEERGRMMPFTDRSSWEKELRRVLPDERANYWRVVDLGADRLNPLAPSYPPCVVVCNGLGGGDIRDGLQAWEGGRFPVWVLSWREASLLRSSLPLRSVTAAATQRRWEERIAGTSSTRDAPYLLRVDDELSRQKIDDSFAALHKICAVDNAARATRYGREWVGRVGESGWTIAVSSLLRLTDEAIRRLVDEGRSVIIQEADGRDVAAAVSSLVQICIDKNARRLDGLERIIYKEWLSLGHPFSRRLLGVGGAGPDGVPFCPVFLLFLDALHQLIRLYPTQFEYSSSLLVGVWDLVLSGTASPFTCDDANDRFVFKRECPIFPLDWHFRVPFTLLFHNISYLAAYQLARIGAAPLFCDLLRPPTVVADVELWDECFLRYQPDSAIQGGGTLLSNWALDRKMNEEIRHELGIPWTLTVGQISKDEISSAFPYSSIIKRSSFSDHRPSMGSISSLRTLTISEHSPPPTPVVVRTATREAPPPPRRPYSAVSPKHYSRSYV